MEGKKDLEDLSRKYFSSCRPDYSGIFRFIFGNFVVVFGLLWMESKAEHLRQVACKAASQERF